jgi:hypothetical protein
MFFFDFQRSDFRRSDPNITWGEGLGGDSKNVTLQFLLIISLVKVNKILCHNTQGRGGGRRNDPKCHIGGRGPKKCSKSVPYYLNGP